VHDGQATLERCLDAVQAAARHPRLRGTRVRVVCALDRCKDRSAEIASAAGVVLLHGDFGKVGLARHAGAELALQLGARWIACTDADSRVHPDWLFAQLRYRSDAVCGVVVLDADSSLPSHTRRLFDQHYQDREGHRHIHGANLGISASWYRVCGGFPPVEVGEDVALVDTLEARGARIAWSASARVTTSARRDGRTPGGFAGYLRELKAT